jgi:hypothetical protein
MVNYDLVAEVNFDTETSQFPRLSAATSAASTKPLIVIPLLTSAFTYKLLCRLRINAL